MLIDDKTRERYDAGENVEDLLSSAENKEKKIKNILMQMFCGVVATVNPDQDNIIKLIQKNLQVGITKMNEAISVEAERKKKFESAIKRCKSSNGNNLFKELALSQVSQISVTIGRLEAEREDLKSAIKFLEDFSYEVEEVMVVQLIRGYGGFTGATTSW